MKITLRAARVNVGLSIIDAASLLNINKGTLSNYETGKTVPRLDFIEQASTLYKIPKENIFFKN